MRWADRSAWRSTSAERCWSRMTLAIPYGESAPRRARLSDPLLIVCRLDPEQGAILLGGEHVEQTVRSLAHVADALVQVSKHRLAADLLPLVIEDNPLQLTGSG